MPEAQIVLRRLSDIEVAVPIVGVTPLIPHRWSEKSKKLMREKQQSARSVRAPREPKNPEQDAHDSCYWLEDGRPGMPAVAFKAAAVGACRFFEGLPMTRAKALFYIVGEGPEQLVPIKGTLSVHEDTPRNADGTADLRYRTYISDWSATLTVRFIEDQISPDSIFALIDAGGRGGVGDWRPSSPKSHTGTYGQFRVPATGGLEIGADQIEHADRLQQKAERVIKCADGRSREPELERRD